ncbi:hypothetical protein BD626DRAFT_520950 [Schizophyllum amplum]|uniref:Uncharacterized protein n=1 Tax=Schizophyllum amplum TaxID=97359 RepID=A0A550BU31_9AGAR|nr:hypothetical protein BD626DRAFT_520950 [Auriculariopsis ampla]
MMHAGTQSLEGKLVFSEGERAGHCILGVVELKQHAASPSAFFGGWRRAVHELRHVELDGRWRGRSCGGCDDGGGDDDSGGGLVDVLGRLSLDELRLLVRGRPQPFFIVRVFFFVRVALVELRRLLVAAGLRVADGIDEPKVIAWDGLLQRRLRLQRLLEMFLELGAVAAGNDGVLVGSSPLANGRLVEGGVDARAGHDEG